MRPPFTVVALSAAVWLVVGVSPASDSPTSTDFANLLFGALSVTGTSCDASPAGIDEMGSPVACAQVTKGWGKVRKAFKRLEREVPDLRKMTEWPRDGRRRRFLLVTDGAVGLDFDTETGFLTVFRGHPCWNATKLDRWDPRVVLHGTNDFFGVGEA